MVSDNEFNVSDVFLVNLETGERINMSPTSFATIECVLPQVEPKEYKFKREATFNGKIKWVSGEFLASLIESSLIATTAEKEEIKRLVTLMKKTKKIRKKSKLNKKIVNYIEEILKKTESN